MARTDTLGHFLTDVADAIRTKTGSSDTIQASNFDTAIENIPSGGSTVDEDADVIFIDYDGTITNSYTKQEFLALNAMPSNPEHEGLISRGWNWSLSDAQDYVTDYDKLTIGQMYRTSDDALKITFILRESKLSPYLAIAVNGTVTVDWGDNTSTTDITSSSTDIAALQYRQHTYASPGKYTISISGTGDIGIYGKNYMSYLLGPNSTGAYSNERPYYLKAITSVITSSKTILGNYAFGTLYNLKYVIISDNFTDTNLSAFYLSYNLKNLIIPNTVETLTGGIEACYSLKNISIPNSVNNSPSLSGIYIKRIEIPKNVTTLNGIRNTPMLNYIQIPNGVTSIPNNMFLNNIGITDIILPDTIETIGSNSLSQLYIINLVLPSNLISIGDYAFYNNYLAYSYDFSKCLSIPTLGNQVFNSIPSDCKIIVPDALYEDWIATANWSTYASYIIKKSDWDNL